MMTDVQQIQTEILIVGSGFGGLGMAIQLKKQGIHHFRIIERADEIGGTWRDNVYPGVACDVPSHLYSFSFLKNAQWSRVFPQGAEIQNYLIQCCEQENIRSHIDFKTTLLQANWDNQLQSWRIKTDQADYVAKYLITATGHLADEHLPNIQGVENFQGKMMHSARWDADIELKNKRVAVIGSGASAIQLVPEVAKVAKELIVFQRSAPYILPRPDRAYSEVEKQLFQKDEQSMDNLRKDIFWANEFNFAQRRNIGKYVQRVKKSCLNFLKQQVSDASLEAKLTPHYEPGCKRLLLSNDYYSTFLLPNVTLEATALKQVSEHEVIGANGQVYDVDVIIFATGFEASRPPYASKVFGKQNCSLEQQWQEGMQGFQSTTVHHFPNLFIINGPNTATGHNSALFFLETQFDLILDALNYLKQENITVFEAKKSAEDRYMAEIQALSEGSIWLSEGCQSWYLDPVSRKLTLIWPDYAHSFRTKNQYFDREGYYYTTAETSHV